MNYLPILFALPFAMWLFLGIEELPLAAEESNDPVRDIPKAGIWARGTLVFTGLLVLFLNTAVLGAEATGVAGEPLLDGFRAIVGDELAWVAGGNGKAPSRLEEIVRHATFPDGPGYVWVAGEARPTRAVRRYLRHVLGWPSDAYKVVGYWTENSEQWMQRYGEWPADLRTHLQEMWSDKTRDVEDVTDEYEQTLETYGL